MNPKALNNGALMMCPIIHPKVKKILDAIKQTPKINPVSKSLTLSVVYQ